MSNFKVAHLSVSYKDAEGNWQLAAKGAEISVHKDDLERLEKSGALEKEPAKKG